MGNWQTVPMGELCSIQSGKSDTKDAVSDGPYAFFDRSKSIKRSSRFLRDCEALIIPGEGTEFLPRHFVGKFDLHQRAYALFDFSSRVDVKYLYHYLHHVADYFPRVAVGATVKSLRLRHFEQLPVRLPDSVTQRRIVAILDEAFEGIATAKANAEKNLQNARELFECHVRSAFEHPDASCQAVRLGDICERVSVGHVGPTSEFYCEPTEGIPFLRSQNVRRGRLSLDGLQFVTEEFHRRLRKSQLRAGDLLFVRVGANRGDCCAVPEVLGELNCANIVFARPRERVARYLEFYCQSTEGRRQLLGMTTGAAQGVINTSAVAELMVPMPPPSARQAVVDHLDAVAEAADQLDEVYRRKVSALAELRVSVLHQAFTGAISTEFIDKQIKAVT